MKRLEVDFVENEILEETTEVSQEDIVESSEVLPEVPEASAEVSPEETDSGAETSQEDLEAGADFIEDDPEAAADTLEESSDSGTALTPENLEDAVYNALEKWTYEGSGQIIVQYYAPGIDKELDKFSLTEVCLVLIVLILLAGSILKIIGGRAHE